MGGGQAGCARAQPAVWCVRGGSAEQIRQQLQAAATGVCSLASLAQSHGPLTLALLVRDAAPSALRRLLAHAAEQMGGLASQPHVCGLADAEHGVYFDPAPPGPQGLAFLFPGQGSQALGMLAPLQTVLAGFDKRLVALDPDGRLRARVQAPPTPENEAALRDTRWAQPALGWVSIALAQALAEHGIKPRLAAGHSYGELCSLAVAGAFDAPTLLRLSATRGALLGAAGDTHPGAMLALRAPTDQIEALLVEAGQAARRGPGAEAGAVLANRNSPLQGVVSGGLAAVARVEALARARGLRCTRLQTACAFHSPLMAGSADHWRAALAAEPMQAPTLATVVANATAAPHLASADSVRELLARQVQAPVLWQASVERLHALGARVFLEVGPGRVLTELAGQILQGRPHLALACDPGSADAGEHLARLLARLASLGMQPALGHLAFLPAPEAASPQVRARPSSSGSFAMHTPLNTFLDVNGRVIARFFEQQAALVALCGDAPASERQQMFSTLVAANQQALNGYLETQQQAVLSSQAWRLLPGLAEAAPAALPPQPFPAPPGSGNSSGMAAQAPAPLPAHQGRLDAPPAVQAPAAAPGSERWFRDLIVQLTGFPLHMVRNDSSFEADLGLDSLTMAEVWFALVDAFPALESRREEFLRCRCLGDGVRLVEALTPQPTAPAGPESTKRQIQGPIQGAAQRPAQSSEPDATPINGPAAALCAEIRSRIAALLGCAPERVGVQADFEQALKLDVFKRTELCEELVHAHPPLAVAGRELLHCQTPAALALLCQRLLGGTEAVAEAERLHEAPPASEPAVAGPAPLARYGRVAAPVAVSPVGTPRLMLPAQLLLAGTAGPLFDQLHAALLGHGVLVAPWHVDAQGWRPATPQARPVIALEDEAGLAAALPAWQAGSAVLFVAGDASAAAWAERIEAAASAPFVLAKAVAGRALAWFSVLGSEQGGPAWAASRGVARTLAREWPATPVRALWLEDALASLTPPAMEAVLAALASGPRSADLRWRHGQLCHWQLTPRPLPPANEPALPLGADIGPDATLLLLGGGDGITAEVAVALATRYRCRIALVGRTPRPAAYPYPQARSEADLRAVLAAELRERAAEDTAAAASGDAERLRARLRQVSRQRAVFETCRRIEAAGAHCHHESADASDAAALAGALTRIRAACGPLRGVVHGVGLAEDARLEKKSLASFRRVVHAKTASVHALHALTRDDPLAFAFLFSSLSAHAGTAGQIDYVAANEVLGEVAAQWNAQVAYPVRALLWSVWSEAGLASPALVRQMARRGLPGIGNAQGTAQLLAELAQGDKAEDWVLLGPQPTLDFALQGQAQPQPLAPASSAAGGLQPGVGRTQAAEGVEPAQSASDQAPAAAQEPAHA